MGILTYIKIVAAVIIIGVCGYFVWNYQHLKSVNAAYKVQVEQLQEANAYYEKQPEIDQKTQEVNDEIQKAVNDGDVERVRDLYKRLRDHQRSRKSDPEPPADDERTDN
jgi:hypothetical protein